jgi:hypothetical protein
VEPSLFVVIAGRQIGSSAGASTAIMHYTDALPQGDGCARPAITGRPVACRAAYKEKPRVRRGLELRVGVAHLRGAGQSFIKP